MLIHDAQFRIVRKDGSIGWNSSSGKTACYYRSKGIEIFFKERRLSADMANQAKAYFLFFASFYLNIQVKACDYWEERIQKSQRIL